MIRIFFALVALTHFACWGEPTPPTPEIKSDLPVSFSIHVSSSLSAKPTTIPPNVVGLSMETNKARVLLTEQGTLGKPSSQPRLSYLNALGVLRASQPPGTRLKQPLLIRVGGNSADNSCFDYAPSEAAMGCTVNLTRADLTAYRDFAAAALANHQLNVSFILDTNLASQHAALGGREIQTAVSMGLFSSGVVSAVEIGNECDSYISTHPHSNLSFASDYRLAFDKFLAAYTNDYGLPNSTVVQGATFADVYRPEYTLMLPAYLKEHRARLFSLSIHNYPTSTCKLWRKAKHTVTMSSLLSWRASRGTALLYAPLARTAHDHNVPFVLGEANSASCGGQANVSDTLGAALWSLDYLSEMSQVGVSQVAFHGGPTDYYTPMALNASTLQVRPLFYGLWMFTELTRGSEAHWLNVTSKIDTAESYRAGVHALVSAKTAAAACCVRVLLIAKDHSARPMNASVSLDASLFRVSSSLTATLVRLNGTTSQAQEPLTAKHLTYAGLTFTGSLDGRPLGARVNETVSLTRDSARVALAPVLVAPASAVTIEVCELE